MAQKQLKKLWYNIVSPKFLGERHIGETYLFEPESAIGRTISINLMQITGDVKNQSAILKFEISGYHDNKLETRITGYNFTPSSIKRFVRRRMTRIDDSLVIKTKDEVRVRVKPFLLTKMKVGRKIEYALRSILNSELIRIINNTNYEDLFSNIIRYQVQKELREKLNKLYPVRTVEIRVLKIEKKQAAESKVVRETVIKVKEPGERKKKKTKEELIDSEVLAEKETTS